MEIKEAITKPNPDTEKAAWKAIAPNVSILKKFFEFSKKMADNIPTILNAIETNPDDKEYG